MKANSSELKIGNYLKHGNILVKVSAIFITHFKCCDLNGIDHGNSLQENFEPIPLTKEWLLKFGFENTYHKMSNCYVFVEGYWRVATKDFIDYSLWHEKVSPPTWCLANFNYVHQLQNLYFALTGEEL